LLRAGRIPVVYRFRLGQLEFGAMSGVGQYTALVLFGAAALVAGVMAISLFRSEVPHAA
jgi:hypothetical protein